MNDCKHLKQHLAESRPYVPMMIIWNPSTHLLLNHRAPSTCPDDARPPCVCVYVCVCVCVSVCLDFAVSALVRERPRQT